MADERGLWGITAAVGERSVPVSDYVRNYQQLLPWWQTREGIVEDFRRWQREGVARHVLVPRVHHDELLEAASRGATVTVFVDLQPKDPFMILGIMRNVSYAAADGGGTAFPNAGVHVVPKRGQAVYFSFRSSDSEGLMEDWHTEHSGCPVRKGKKWVVTQWLRDGVSKENPHSRFDPSGGPVR